MRASENGRCATPFLCSGPFHSKRIERKRHNRPTLLRQPGERHSLLNSVLMWSSKHVIGNIDPAGSYEQRLKAPDKHQNVAVNDIKGVYDRIWSMSSHNYCISSLLLHSMDGFCWKSRVLKVENAQFQHLWDWEFEMLPSGWRLRSCRLNQFKNLFISSSLFFFSFLKNVLAFIVVNYFSLSLMYVLLCCVMLLFYYMFYETNFSLEQ